MQTLLHKLLAFYPKKEKENTIPILHILQT